MLTSPRTLKYFQKSLTIGQFWQLYSHPYEWNLDENVPEYATLRGNLYRWRLSAATVAATTVFISLRAVLSLLDPEASVLVRVQLSFVAIVLILTSNYQFINLKKRSDLVGFAKRYLTLAKFVQRGNE